MSSFTKQDLKEKSTIELKGILNSLGENTKGNKNALIHRILEHQKQDQPDYVKVETSESPVLSDAGSESEEDEFLTQKPQVIEEDKKMSQTQLRVIKLISRPRESRSNPEIDMLLPWLKKKSDVMRNLEDHILKDIVRECDHLKVEKDELIIRQGDIGDCFYILLRGSVSVFISDAKEDESAQSSAKTARTDLKKKWKMLTGTVVDDLKTNRSRKVNRKDFGKKVVTFESGKAFGEIALLTDDRVRTASIISEENCDLMVINRSVYNSTLKAYHEREFEEKRNFIENNFLFNEWNKKYKKQLERSLVKECFAMDMPVFKQGQDFSGLVFILRGNAKVLVEPDRHDRQYPQMRPFQTENDIYELEDMRPKKRKKKDRHPGMTKLDEPEAKSAVSRRSAPDELMLSRDHRRHGDGMTNEQVRVKRKEGYVAAEKRMLNRSIILCVVRDGAMFGDLELVQNLKTYSSTVVTTTYTEVFTVSIKNVERLVTKRHPETLTMIEDIVLTKLCNRSTYVQGCNIPLVNHLVFKMTDEQQPVKRRPPTLKQSSKNLPDRFSLFQHIMEEYLNDKAPLMDTTVPGGAYYKSIMRERAARRAFARRDKDEERRREIEREVREKIFKREQVRRHYSESEDEDTGKEEANKQTAEEETPKKSTADNRKSVPIILTPQDEGESKQESKMLTATLPMFATEVAEKEEEKSESLRPSRLPTRSEKRVFVDTRPDTMRNQSFFTVCIVYDEDTQKSKITHAGSLMDLSKDPDETLMPQNVDTRPTSRCPSDARMVGAPLSMESRENTMPSRKSSSKSKHSGDVTSLPTSGKLRTPLPPVNEDKKSKARLLSPRGDLAPKSKRRPFPSPVTGSRGDDTKVSLPEVTQQYNVTQSTRAPPVKRRAQVKLTQAVPQEASKVHFDVIPGSHMSETSSTRTHKSEAYRMKPLLINDLELPKIESKKKTNRTSKSKLSAKA